MPNYRSPIRYTEEQKRNLKVDVKRIPEWQEEIRSIRALFRKYDPQKVAGAATLIQEMQEKLHLRDVFRSTEDERKSLEQWKQNLTTDRLAGLVADYSAPHFVRDRVDKDIVGIIRTTLQQTEQKLAEIQSKGVTNSIWGSVFTSKVDVGTLNYWKSQREQYLVYARAIPRIQEALRLLDQVRNESKQYAGRVAKIQERLDLAEQKQEAIERFEEKHGKSFAKAAAVDKQTRSRANSLKRLVKKTKHCPYCGGDLGSDPHLDHIYPVSKGGLSIMENLVWCCSQCNAVKTDKGLMQFLRERHLPIEKTLDQLHALGKHV